MKKISIYLLALIFSFGCSDNDKIESCILPSDIVVENIYNTFATINWSATSDRIEIEYGPQGFILGNGQKVSSVNSTFTISNLESNTTYDAYIRANCGEDNYSQWIGPYTYTTLPACIAPSFIEKVNSNSCSITFNWDISGTSNWIIEYGETGFNLGQGTIINTTENYAYYLDGLSGNTSYDIYVRADCDTDGLSDYTGPLTVTTDNATFTGNYLYESIIEGHFGPIFGLSKTVTLVDKGNGTRTMNVTYYDQIEAGQDPIDFEFTLGCDGFIYVKEDQDTNYMCDAELVKLGPLNPQPYNTSYDDFLEFEFVEFYQSDESCGYGEYGVKIKLTKQ